MKYLHSGHVDILTEYSDIISVQVEVRKIAQNYGCSDQLSEICTNLVYNS